MKNETLPAGRQELKTLIKIGASLAGLFLPSIVYAQIPISPAPRPIGAPPVGELGNIIGNALTLVIIVASLLTVGYLIWGGIEWLTSGGEKASYEAARNRITHAFLGLGIVVGAYLIIKIVEGVLGIKILGGFTIPKLWNYPD